MAEQETRGASLQLELRRVEGAVTAAGVALKVSETRHEKALQDQIARVSRDYYSMSLLFSVLITILRHCRLNNTV